MDGDLARGEPILFDRTANAVQDVIAVCLDQHLYPGTRHIGHKLSHQCLASRMKVYLWVLDQYDVALGRRQGGYHDGQSLGEAEPRVDRAVEFRGVRGA